jgi:uncharacterized lipoprotein YmbA
MSEDPASYGAPQADESLTRRARTLARNLEFRGMKKDREIAEMIFSLSDRLDQLQKQIDEGVKS